MLRILPAVFCLALWSTGALAQAGGGGGTGGGGGAASSGGGARSSAPAAAAPSATAPGTTATPGSPNVPGISPGRPAPGVGSTPVDPQRNNVDANPPTQRLPGTTANAPNGSLQPGAASPNAAVPTPSGSGRPDPGGANSSPGTAGAGKDPAKSALADCMGLWDKGTHMTKAEWATTCRRVQGRLDNLKIDPVAPSAASKRQKSARGQDE